MPELKPESWLVSAGRPEEAGAPLNTPLIPASNFRLGGERVYTRDSGAPGWEALEDILAGLEGGAAVAFSSGMAAVAAVFDRMSKGAHVVIPDDCYQGVAALARHGETRGIWSLRRLAVDDTDAWAAMAGEADLLWLESPSNPLLTVADLATICAAPRKAGCLLVVDNTFATPLNQRPLLMGADVSLHSATKFIGGHSDLLAGVLATSNLKLLEGFRRSRSLAGATPGALEAFLAVRGLRTLALRLEKAQETAGHLAEWLEASPAVSQVRYPGLTSHPTHSVAVAQLAGFGSMISFDLAAGAEAADAVCANVGLIRHATSLGSVESTMERRAAVAGQEHLPPSMLRLSVGIEHFDDLRDDLERAFAAAGA